MFYLVFEHCEETHDVADVVENSRCVSRAKYSRNFIVAPNVLERNDFVDYILRVGEKSSKLCCIEPSLDHLNRCLFARISTFNVAHVEQGVKNICIKAYLGKENKNLAITITGTI